MENQAIKIIEHIDKIKLVEISSIPSTITQMALFGARVFPHFGYLFFSTSFPTIVNFHSSGKASRNTPVAQHKHSSCAEDNEWLCEG